MTSFVASELLNLCVSGAFMLDRGFHLKSFIWIRKPSLGVVVLFQHTPDTKYSTKALVINRFIHARLNAEEIICKPLMWGCQHLRICGLKKYHLSNSALYCYKGWRCFKDQLSGDAPTCCFDAGQRLCPLIIYSTRSKHCSHFYEAIHNSRSVYSF